MLDIEIGHSFGGWFLRLLNSSSFYISLVQKIGRVFFCFFFSIFVSCVGSRSDDHNLLAPLPGRSFLYDWKLRCLMA